MFKFKGKHVMAEFYGVSHEYLTDYREIYPILKKGIKVAKVTQLNECFHQFEPAGFTLLILLAESHISLHTYPEKKSMFMDIFTCGDKNPELVFEVLKKELKITKYKKQVIIRGNTKIKEG